MNGFRVVYGVLGNRAVRCLALLLCVGTNQVATAVDGSVQSRFVWSTSRPEDQQLNRARLEAMRQALAERQTDGLLVIRNDAVVQEWYSGSSGPAKAHYTASLAKALVGGVALAVALSDGRICLDDPAAKFVPQWQADSRKSRITLRQLGSHTSGIEDAEADNLPHAKLTGWKGDFWKQLDTPADPFSLSRDAAPLVCEPGERMQYSNPGIAMMAYCITAALRGAPQADIRSLLRDRVMRPIGVDDAEWAVGYGKVWRVDGLPVVATWGGGSYTARAAATVGRLMLREGNWEGEQLISREAVRLTTRDAGTPGHCGIGWWSNNDGSCAELPRDAFWGAGAGHQILLVVPSLNLLAVRNGQELERTDSEPSSFLAPVRRLLFRPLMAALLDAPAPASLSSEAVASQAAYQPHTQVTIRDARWRLNEHPTYPGSPAEGLLMNVRMVNAVFEDRERPGFDAEANTSEFIARIPEYVRSGMRAFTLCLQGGMPGYEGAVNSGFNPEGSLRDSYLQRLRRVVEACDREGAAVILSCYYQRQDQILRDEAAVRRGVVNVATWIRDHGFRNVLLEIANEFGHPGFDHPCLRTAEGIAELIELARRTAPDLLVAASGLGDGTLPERVARASDYLLVHFNGTQIDEMPARMAALEKYRKPVVCNEDEKTGDEGAQAAEMCVKSGASWGLMLVNVNQRFPFTFGGTADDPKVYAVIRRLTSRPTDAVGVPDDE